LITFDKFTDSLLVELTSYLNSSRASRSSRFDSWLKSCFAAEQDRRRRGDDRLLEFELPAGLSRGQLTDAAVTVERWISALYEHCGARAGALNGCHTLLSEIKERSSNECSAEMALVRRVRRGPRLPVLHL